MPKPTPPLDVLILGRHPAASLAAIALHAKPALNILHAAIPGEPILDRLVNVNPAFFRLHPSLQPLAKSLALSPVHGLRFLSPDAKTPADYRAKSPLAYVVCYSELTSAIQQIAQRASVPYLEPKTLQINSIDETGLDVFLDNTRYRAKALILAGDLPEMDKKRLGMDEKWESSVVQRYSFVGCVSVNGVDSQIPPVQPMCLNLNDNLCWGWYLSTKYQGQIAVQQPVDTISKIPPADLLAQWFSLLKNHGILPGDINHNQLQSIDLPLAGALVHEGVANRTLLVGPAGGFFSACSEDIYPNCWSAIHAADTMRKALKEKHLQDSLNDYRFAWRTTLGDYLRGPQQNLRFLLPLVYRNPVMTQRLTESILLGKSVVR